MIIFALFKLILFIVMITIKQITTVEQLYKSQGAATGNVIVDAIMEYVKCTSSHSGEEAAVCLGVNQRWLSHSIKIFVGVTLSQFILEWRVRQALDLLDNESLSYDEVASRTGFSSYQHFSEAMCKLFGVTPYQYRTESVLNHGRSELYNSRKKQQAIVDIVKKLKSRNNTPS